MIHGIPDPRWRDSVQVLELLRAAQALVPCFSQEKSPK